MSMISGNLPYILYCVPFIVAVIVLIKARLDVRRAEKTSEYERFVWSERPEEPEIETRAIQRRYVSYSA